MVGNMFDGLGLNIASKLNDMYGKKYSDKPVDTAKSYGSCKRCCGVIPKVVCVPCAPCDCGPVRKISTGHIGLIIEFGRLIKKLPPGLHTLNNCTEKLLIVDIRTKILDIPP
jgi:hypothetical protein